MTKQLIIYKHSHNRVRHIAKVFTADKFGVKEHRAKSQLKGTVGQPHSERNYITQQCWAQKQAVQVGDDTVIFYPEFEVTPEAETQVRRGRSTTTRGSEEGSMEQCARWMSRSPFHRNPKLENTVRGDSTSQGRSVSHQINPENFSSLYKSVIGLHYERQQDPVRLFGRMRDSDVATRNGHLDGYKTGSSHSTEFTNNTQQEVELKHRTRRSRSLPSKRRLESQPQRPPLKRTSTDVISIGQKREHTPSMTNATLTRFRDNNALKQVTFSLMKKGVGQSPAMNTGRDHQFNRDPQTNIHNFKHHRYARSHRHAQLNVQKRKDKVDEELQETPSPVRAEFISPTLITKCNVAQTTNEEIINEMVNNTIQYKPIYDIHLEDDPYSDQANIGEENEGLVYGEARPKERLVDRWCRELVGDWTAGYEKEENGTDIDSASHHDWLLSERVKPPRDIEHKAQILAITMHVNGKDLPVEDVKQTQQKLSWDLKDRTIDDILNNLDKIKNDPSIPTPHIEADPATLEEFLKYSEGLPTMAQIGKMDIQTEDEQTKDAPSLEQLAILCTDSLHQLKPTGFPDDLWKYTFDTQKYEISQRWEGYDPTKVTEKIEQLKSELKISQERPYAIPYYIAQAIANLDRFMVKESDGTTPLIDAKFTHGVELMSGTRPVREKPQRFSETQNAFLRAKLNILEKQGKVLRRSGLQEGDWLHRMVLVEYPDRMAAFRAKHGENVMKALNDPANEYEVSQLFRLTIDCRELNKCTIVEPYPMPDNNMGKENIIGSRYMSTSDAADAFYAVQIRPEDYGKTGITAVGSQWVLTVMLQGGVNSPRHFARIIQETFEGIPRSKICPFQDDALVHGKYLLEALENQQLMYDCIRKNSIMLKGSKTKLAFSTVKFLGNIYTPMGRLPDPSKVETIIQIHKKPTTPKEVRHIVGLMIWNIEFIPNGMALLSHLTDLVRKDADVVALWKDEVHGKILEQLKSILVSAPCLQPIDTSRPFRVHVDACKMDVASERSFYKNMTANGAHVPTTAKHSSQPNDNGQQLN